MTARSSIHKANIQITSARLLQTSYIVIIIEQNVTFIEGSRVRYSRERYVRTYIHAITCHRQCVLAKTFQISKYRSLAYRCRNRRTKCECMTRIQLSWVSLAFGFTIGDSRFWFFFFFLIFFIPAPSRFHIFFLYLSIDVEASAQILSKTTSAIKRRRMKCGEWK